MLPKNVRMVFEERHPAAGDEKQPAVILAAFLYLSLQ
jgi:hypothetical protein